MNSDSSNSDIPTLPNEGRVAASPKDIFAVGKAYPAISTADRSSTANENPEDASYTNENRRIQLVNVFPDLETPLWQAQLDRIQKAKDLHPKVATHFLVGAIAVRDSNSEGASHVVLQGRYVIVIDQEGIIQHFEEAPTNPPDELKPNLDEAVAMANGL